MIKENTENSLEKINAATQCKMRYADSSDNNWKTGPAKAMTAIHSSTGLLSSNGISMSKLKTLTHVNQIDKNYFRRSRSEVGTKQCRNEKMNLVVSTGKKQIWKDQSLITIKSPPLLQKTRKLPLNTTSGINTVNKQILTGNRNRRHKSASLHRKQPILIIVLNDSRRKADYPEKKYRTLKKTCVAASVNVEKQNIDVIRECEEKPQYSKTVVIVNEKICFCKPDLLKRQLIQSVAENILLSSSGSHNIGDDFFKLILIMNLTQYLLHCCHTEINSDILSESIIGEDLCSVVVELQNLSAHQPQQYYVLLFEESSAVDITQASADDGWIEEMQILLESCTDNDNSNEQHNEPTTVPTNTVIYITLMNQKELKNMLRIILRVEEQYKGEQVTQTIRRDNVKIDNLIVTPYLQTYPTYSKHQELNITEKISEQPVNMRSSGILNLELLKSQYEENNFVRNQFSPVHINEKNSIAIDVPQQPLIEFILSHTEAITKDHSQINNISDHYQSVEVRRLSHKTDTASGFCNWLVKFINSGCIRRKRKALPRKSLSHESILSPVSQNINDIISLKEVSHLLSLLSNTDEHKLSMLESTETLNAPDIRTMLLNVQQLIKLKHEDIDPKRISNDEDQDFNKLLHSIKTQIRFSDEDSIHEDNYREDCTNISGDNRKSNSLRRSELPVNDEIKTMSEYKSSANDKRQVEVELKQHCKQANSELCDPGDRWHLNTVKTVDFVSAPSSVLAVEHQKQETPSSSVLTDKTHQPTMRHTHKHLKQIKQKQLKKKASTNITNLLLKLIDRKRQNIVDNRMSEDRISQQEQRERIVSSSQKTEGTLHLKEKDDKTSPAGYAKIRKSEFLVKQKPTGDVESEVNKLRIQSKEDSIIREYHLRDSTIFPRSRSETTVGNKPEIEVQAIICVDNTVLETALERLYASFEISSTNEWNQTLGMFIVISDKHRAEIQDVYKLNIKRHDNYILEPDTMKFIYISNRQVNYQVGEFLILQLQPVQDINNLEILERMQDYIKWMLVSEEEPLEQNYLMCTINLRLFSKLETRRHEQLQIEDELSITFSESIIKHHYMNSMHSLEVYRPSYRCFQACRIPFTEPPGLYRYGEGTNTREDEYDDATCLTGSLVSFLTSSDKILYGDNNKDDQIHCIRQYNSMTEASVFNDYDDNDESDSYCLRHHSSSDQQLRLTKINPVLGKPVNNLKTKKQQLYFPVLLQRETELLFQSVELSKIDSNESATPTPATMTVITMPTAEMNSVSSCRYIQY
uniref:Uncharacterized protein n=1 Tax=Trichobilharzia regenti TaxID=157069 RepID=A0AA85JBN3_TRIRE|nr:unnamed protein product [Trichobilharzia regenti]